jgi:ubiquinone/menaquinone biosynthesis C-methylase UbiE
MSGSDDLSKNIVENYSQVESPLGVVLSTLSSVGKTVADITISDLEGATQFHAGGGIATLKLFEELQFTPGEKVLDIGSGLGGPAFICAALGCSVEGIDLTPSFVEAATALADFPRVNSEISKNNGSATFTVGDVSSLPGIEGDNVDKSYMIHVGMNLHPDVKVKMATELYRVLKPGGMFGIFDAVLGNGEPSYPLPFATCKEQSFVGKHEEYTSVFEAAGFRTVANESVDPRRGGFDLHTVEMQGVASALLGAGNSTSELRLSADMGSSWNTRRKNYFEALGKGAFILRRIVFKK